MGRFRIVRFINSGGMGEVYEAWDSELGERVALKTIRPEIASFPPVIERFKQEVRQARGVSHVNVCRVYEMFSHVQDSGDHVWFLTMELLAGRTLSEYLSQHAPMSAKQALNVIEQMVSGLAAAHEHGVVHGDFKSSNVMLVDGPAGKTRVVVTDFGLSFKGLAGRGTRSEQCKVGTPRYMAPEQLEGKEVGFAADQYALGVVICEMLTGVCPLPTGASFDRSQDLAWAHIVNARWEQVVRRCLQVRPEDRFPNIRDITSVLTRGRRRGIPWAMAAAVLSSIALFVALESGQSGEFVEAAAQLTPDTDLTSRPSLARDGRIIAYSSDRAESGNLDIWVQHLPVGTPTRLTTDPAEDVDPNIAPDGSAVVFRSERAGGGIYIIDIGGGRERLLAPDGRNPRFSPDGRSVAYWVGDNDSTIASGKVFLLSLANRVSTRLLSDFTDARYPVWSSDGSHILFSGCRALNQPLPGCSEWWVATRDGKTINDTGTLALLRKHNIQLVDLIGGWYGDKVLFSGRQQSTTSLWEVTIPLRSLRATGIPRPITSGEPRAVAPCLANSGSIAFERLTSALHVWRIEHSSDPGKALASKLTHDPTFDVSPDISSNGQWLVFARGYQGHRDLWVRNMISGKEALFYAAPGDKLSPIIDNSGTVVVLETREKEVPSLFIMVRDQFTRTLGARCSNPTGWFDETHSVFCRQGVPSVIALVNVDTAKVTTVLEKANQSLSEATWSPRSQYLLFTASPDGVSKRIFAVLFPKSERQPKGQWIPLTPKAEFNDRPRWSGDGKTVFYLSRRDGFSCVWGQHFDSQSGRAIGVPFAVMHFHDPRFSPHVVLDRAFNLSVAGDSVYLNIGEINTSVWVGRLRQPSLLSALRDFR
ncbi:MAG: protein kinase [Acidobacteria bacterium]|nr:protein kinase [Acidobacteriota bacterium]